MERRDFMLSIILAVIEPVTRQARIARFDGAYLMEIGCLHCAIEKQSLTVNVFVERRWPNGRVEVRRMVPTELLRRRLRESGLDLEREGHHVYPSLIGRVDHGLSPEALGRLLTAVLDGCDWRSLYDEPRQDWNYGTAEH